MKHTLLISFLLVAILSPVHGISHQIFPEVKEDTSAKSQELAFGDTFGRATPRGTVKGYFTALRKGDYPRALKYLDLSPIPDKDRQSKGLILVEEFEAFLDKGGNIDPINLINDQSVGDTEDGLDPDVEVVGMIYWEGESIPIFLERVTLEGEQLVWLFSWQTIQKIPKEFDVTNEVFIEKIMPKGSLQSKWRGAQISHWLAICLLAIGSYLFAWLITMVLNWMIRLWWSTFAGGKHASLIRTFLIPLRIVIAVAIFVTLARALDISILVRQSFSIINLSFLWIALFIFIWLLIGTLFAYGEQRLREKNNVAGLSVTLFLRNSAKFVLIAFALIMILDTLGVNVTAGLAALGIGGIALALGAQKTIENLVGSLTVVFDQPVRVGDFCKFGAMMGTVESIGMRSTRIRTLDRTVVTIPNGDFASQLIENYTQRDKFLYKKILGLRYETSSDQMRYILVELRRLLYAHPKVDQDPARVRFLEYGSDSLQVELFAYIHAQDYNEFLAVQEDINLRLAHVIEESGSGFAFPSQTVYLSKDAGLSKTKSGDAEKKVQQWMQDGELELPEFDGETINRLKGTIKYPPEGSSGSNTEDQKINQRSGSSDAH